MSLRKCAQFLIPKNALKCVERRNLSKAAKKAQPQTQRNLNDVGQSLASKGFLRSHKPYTAPSDAAERVRVICATLQIPTKSDYKLTSLEQKFKFLEACVTKFQHSVPNSQMHEIETVGDVIRFYEASLNTSVPFDELKNADLPENLHVQQDYVRFHPYTDTKFGGQTAFPKSSTLVTGLKYRGKYEGHEAKRSWP